MSKDIVLWNDLKRIVKRLRKYNSPTEIMRSVIWAMDVAIEEEDD